MTPRPYVLISCAMSMDGYLDDTCERRLILSNELDLDRVDAVRAQYDAILVGSTTIRRDNPRLLVRSADRRADRTADGRPPSPAKVTLTRSGNCDPTRRFFADDGTEKFVYCDSAVTERVRQRLGERALVRDGGRPVDLHWVLYDLVTSGVRRLMVEGGATIHRQLLTAGLVDEVHLVIAPFFVGDPAAPRFAHGGPYPQDAANPAKLVEARALDDVVLLRYATSDRYEETTT